MSIRLWHYGNLPPCLAYDLRWTIWIITLNRLLDVLDLSILKYDIYRCAVIFFGDTAVLIEITWMSIVSPLRIRDTPSTYTQTLASWWLICLWSPSMVVLKAHIFRTGRNHVPGASVSAGCVHSGHHLHDLIQILRAPSMALWVWAFIFYGEESNLFLYSELQEQIVHASNREEVILPFTDFWRAPGH